MARRIALVIHSLAGGGAERVATVMAHHWAQQGDDVTFITLDSDRNDAYTLDPQVQRIALDQMRESSSPLTAVWGNLCRIKRLRTALRSCRPDHVVSLVEKMNIVTLLASKGLGLDVVICERVHPRRYPIGPVWSLLRRLTYPHCRALTVQTRQIAEYSRRLVGRRPIYVVPNPVVVDVRPGEASPAGSGGQCQVVAMGRLVPQKGFDLLIEAFARVAGDHPRWKLLILGEGPQRGPLEQQIERQGLAGRVELPGWVAEPARRLRQSHLFVLSSRFEGFPMVLLEAMACGLPVISFQCESGPADIVRDSVDGLLVPPEDVAGLASALHQLMGDDRRRTELARRACEVRERFSKEKFFQLWETVLCNAAPEGTPSRTVQDSGNPRR